MNVVTVADLAKVAGRDNARGIAEWADKVINALGEIFHEAPPEVSGLLMPLGLLLTELAGAVNATLDTAEREKAINDDIVDGHNRASALQRATLHLLNHLQQFIENNLADVVPPPSHQLGHECVCDRKSKKNAKQHELLN